MEKHSEKGMHEKNKDKLNSESGKQVAGKPATSGDQVNKQKAQTKSSGRKKRD